MLERQSKTDLADALLGLACVASEGDRLHEGAVVHTLRVDLQERILRVEQVEDLANRLDAGRAAHSERAADAQIYLRERRAAAAVDGVARADLRERGDA